MSFRNDPCIIRKYPRTSHLPWSPGKTDDDINGLSLDLNALLNNRKIVITEKMDGENTTMYMNHIHARSITSSHHWSRTRVKQLHSNISHQIPEGWRICGENMQAVHSLAYNNLPDWFLVFSMWRKTNCLSWADTELFSDLLSLKTVPVLYKGKMDLSTLFRFHESLDLKTQEGYVIRNAQNFEYDDFSKNVFKWVRADHVTTDKHWLHQVAVENSLDMGEER